MTSRGQLAGKAVSENAPRPEPHKPELDQLARILNSPIFRNSRRASDFLRFIVERTLAGEAQYIKEYRIGLEVFERNGSYDPKLDPVVRIEAGRLRTKLAEYYRTQGQNDPILIELPKGTYVPVFQQHRPSAPANKVPLQSQLRSATPWLALLLVIAVFAGSILWRSRRTPAIHERDTIVLADFTNHTSDSVFDGTLKQALSIQLESPFLNILSEDKVKKTLKLMGRAADASITPDIATEICVRNGGRAVIAGSISSLNTVYVLGLQASACSTGETLAQEQVQVAKKEEILPALARQSSNLRVKLGESLPSLQKFAVPAEATTSSLEALQAYTLATTVSHNKGSAEAVPLLRRALELDPKFASAYLALGANYANLAQTSLAEENFRKAYQLRDRASEREKYNISTAYYNSVTGEIEKSIEVSLAFSKLYPQDFPSQFAIAQGYSQIGQWDKTLAQLEKIAPYGPNEVLNGNLAATYLAVNRRDQAKAALDQALAGHMDGGFLRQQMYVLAFLNGNQSGMEQQVKWGAGRPGDEDDLFSMQSDTEAYYGRLKKAREYSKRAIDSALRAGDKETAGLWQVNAALHEAEFENFVEARRATAAALSLSRGREVRIAAALAFARIGDSRDATNLLDELHKAQPLSTILNVYWIPTIRAAQDLDQGKSAQAIESLQVATTYELAECTVIGYLYPAYVRGEAYLHANNGVAAAAEFQKLLDHSGIVLNFPTGALARLQLARAYALQNDSARAKLSYQEFLNLWKDADPDIPILKQARAEYANLK